MRLPDTAIMAAHFARSRWQLDFHDRDALEGWQQRQVRHFLRHVLPRAPHFRQWAAEGNRAEHSGLTLADLPIMDKAVLMADFMAFNTRGIALETALPLALQAEQSRDFSPMLGDLTVGLSSGTSGNRGVFLVSRAERLRWAGILLARMLSPAGLRRILSPWQPPLRIAFFLRANSNLYTTLQRRRIDFAFHDLLDGAAAALPRLRAQAPDILVGPPSLLRQLAAAVQAGEWSLQHQPMQVISVAEVLEADDQAVIQAAFAVAPRQLYQATEGFLAYTCEQGGLHLNETFVHIEPEWLDSPLSSVAPARFQPLITDFSRSTQLIVRYRLNDVLRLAPPCPCGRAERTLAAIEGRADDIFWLPAQSGQGKDLIAIYPDFVRRAMLLAGQEIEEFTVIQDGMCLHIALQLAAGTDAASVQARLHHELAALWQRLQAVAPALSFGDWCAPLPGQKRRRVRCLRRPDGAAPFWTSPASARPPETGREKRGGEEKC